MQISAIKEQLPYPLFFVVRFVYKAIFQLFYHLTIWILFPLNLILSLGLRGRMNKKSVLHISDMVHIPYFTVSLLKEKGVMADYLAIGTSSAWNKSDYTFNLQTYNPFKRALSEFWIFWSLVSKYKILHLHFMRSISENGWEFFFLRLMGRKIVVHFRGCEARNRKVNRELHPKSNICQKCDYNAEICTNRKGIRKKRILRKKYGDYFLVTTPDLQDFIPEAHHFPFFSPITSFTDKIKSNSCETKSSIKLVHVTNHPGIEGTEEIIQAVENLKLKGFAIDFLFLRGAKHEKVLEEYSTADLAIGKMKMGYYANAQIESMHFGVPTITYVRPEFMTEELKNSGFIFSNLEDLEETLENYLENPEKLSKKREETQKSIRNLHDNNKLTEELIGIYEKVAGERFIQPLRGYE